MGLNAERHARWRANAEIERLRKAAAEQAEQLAEARREIEIAVLERETATLKTALAHERKQLAEAKKLAEAKTRAAKPAAPPAEPGGEDPRIAPSDAQAAIRERLEACGLVMDNVDEEIDWLKCIVRGGSTMQRGPRF
jgi:hypothetical protein